VHPPAFHSVGYFVGIFVIVLKRLLVILFSFLYLASISGVEIHTHYCGNRLVDWNIGAKAEGCGSCDASASPKKCCKDKVVSLKGAVDQHAAADIIKVKFTGGVLLFAATPLHRQYAGVAYGGCYRALVYAANAPPGPWQQIPLFKLHSSFTYYG
jgi:hypothetical protein